MSQISVIVPVYKVEPYLRRCVDSILAQTFTDFECILVDDGSPDNCPAICDEYAQRDNRVRVIHQENGGLSAARNAGIDWAFEHSDSEWISFIDSDDWVHTRYLELLMDATLKYSAEIAVCRYEKVTEKATELVQKTASVCLTPEEYWISEQGSMVAVCKLYSKHLFGNIRYPIGKLHEDEFVTYLPVFSASRIGVVQAQLYYYFQREGSIIHTDWNPEKMAVIDAIEEQVVFFRTNGYRKAFQDTCRKAVICYADNLIRANQSTCAINSHLKTLRRFIRKACRRYRKIVSFPVKGNEWVYATAYPKFMNLYWYIQVIKNKLFYKTGD